MLTHSITPVFLIFFFLATQTEAGWKKPWTDGSKKIHKMTKDTSMKRQSNEDWSPYERFKDNGPSASISIGTPAQQYDVSIRTNHDTLWLAGSKFGNKHYDPSKSSSSIPTKNTFSEFFGKGKLTGSQFVDKVSTTSSPFMRAANFNQLFTVLNQLDDLSYGDLVDSKPGIIGFGWNVSDSGKTLTQNSAPILHLLDELKDRYFTLWLSRTSNDEGDFSVESEISYGQPINASLCDPHTIYYVPFNNQAPLSFQVQQIKFKSFGWKRSLKAWIDTETFYLGLPTAQYKAISKELNAVYNEELDILVVPCRLGKTAPEISFTMNNVDMIVEGNQYVSEIGLGHNQCALLLAENKDPAVDIVLGTPFVHRWCTTFDVDQNRLGLSKSTQIPKPS